jgi:hypothetical protein
MDTTMILGIAIASLVALDAAVWLWAPKDFLRGFMILGRSLGRML